MSGMKISLFRFSLPETYLWSLQRSGWEVETLGIYKGHFQRLLLPWLNEVHEMPEQTACSPSHLTAETVCPVLEELVTQDGSQSSRWLHCTWGIQLCACKQKSCLVRRCGRSFLWQRRDELCGLLTAVRAMMALLWAGLCSLQCVYVLYVPSGSAAHPCIFIWLVLCQVVPLVWS